VANDWCFAAVAPGLVRRLCSADYHYEAARL
jgi:hypothetical protein